MTDQPKINTKIEKSFPMPKPSPWPTSLEARHLVPMADKMGNDTLGQAVHETAIRALEAAENAVNEITKAEHAVQVEQLALEKSGQANQRLVQKDGKIYAVGGKFGELAQLSDKVLGKEQEDFDAAVRRVATHQESMAKQMDAKLVCKDTQADAPLRSDLRNFLKGLGSNKATYEAIKAASEGDLAMIHTVLTSPTRLTGLAQADLDTVRTEARKKLAPDLFLVGPTIFTKSTEETHASRIPKATQNEAARCSERYNHRQARSDTSLETCQD